MLYDKVERSGIRICDLMNAEIFSKKVRENVVIKNKIIKHVYDSDEVLMLKRSLKNISYTQTD